MNYIKYKGLEEIKDVVFIKDFSKENSTLKNLENKLNYTINADVKAKINKDISLIKQGLEGESRVYFELKSSLLPIVCLHDVRIKSAPEKDDKESFSQIDFIVITNKFICVMETKNLAGNIELNESGEFIRDINFKDNSIREGMYNPLSQAKRHSKVLKNALEKAGILKGMEAFPVKYIAVMANYKTIIDRSSAPKDVKSSVYRCDQIVSFLEEEMSSDEYDLMLSDSKIMKIGNSILNMHTPKDESESDTHKFSVCNYNNYENNKVAPGVLSKSLDVNSNVTNIQTYLDDKHNQGLKSKNTNISVSLSNDDYKKERIVKRFRKFRYESAEERNLKPYEVFTDKEMLLMIEMAPTTLEGLKKVNLRSWVVNELGIEILKILNPNISYEKNTAKANLDNIQYLESKLKEYRSKMAKINKVPMYEIFTNSELSRLIEAMPRSVDELFEIKGFSKNNKINNYGKDILNIING